jgi:calpain-15
MSTTVQEIRPGIKFIRCVLSDTEQQFSMENGTESPITFTVDLTGSRGVTMVDHPDLINTVTIPPKQTAVLAYIINEDDWEMKTKFKFSMAAPQPQVSDEKLNKDRNKLDSEIQLFKEFYRSNNHYTRLTADNLPPSKLNFIDPYFPPVDGSIFDGCDGAKLGTVVQWRRPTDFFDGKYAVFDKIEPADIKQGRLGDCWFMCALSSIAERPALVQRLFITKEVQPHGVYKVQFCKGGEWVEVTVDDYFPCLPGAGPIFSRSNGNELWVLLLEKAYAKLHGSYMLLRGGWAFEGMMDLTGCPTGQFTFDEPRTIEIIQSGYLWEFLKNIDEEGALISASTPGKDKFTEGGGPDAKGGLVPGHAYTVIQVKEVAGNQLLNVRNPWGNFEWEGDWSDKSPLWTPDMIAALNPILTENDGTFWMCWQDFLKNFKGVNFCRVANFQEVRKKGVFQQVHYLDEDFVLSKEVYSVECDQDTKVFIGLHQDDERLIGVSSRRTFIDLGIVVLEVEGDSYQVAEYKEQATERQVELEFNLLAGKRYVIVPLTTGCNLCRQSEGDSPLKLFDHGELHTLLESNLKDIFRKANSCVGEGLSYSEFQNLMSQVEVSFSADEFEELKSKVASVEDGITKEGFIEYIRGMERSHGEDKIREWLSVWGYDEYLYSVKSRSYILTVHSYTPLNVYNIPSDPKEDLTIKAWTLVLNRYGDVRHENNGVNTHRLKHSQVGASTFAVMNPSQKNVTVTCDYSASEGLIFSCGKSKVTKVIRPGQFGSIIHYTVGKYATVGRSKFSFSVAK